MGTGMQMRFNVPPATLYELMNVDISAGDVKTVLIVAKNVITVCQTIFTNVGSAIFMHVTDAASTACDSD